MLRNASRVMIRIAGPGVTVWAVLLVFAAYAQEPRTEPQLNAILPAPAAQPPAAEPPAAQPPAAQPPNPSFRPGFIDVFGRFIGDSAAKLNSQLKSTNETLGNIGSQTSSAAKDAAMGAVGSARDAAGTIVGLPSARMVSGRERCAAAPNGAPDCRAAADAACRAKGFGSGRSLDTQSVQKCPARVWLSGHLPAEGECPHETFVTRAVCQ
jgi:hypothetical protein